MRRSVKTLGRNSGPSFYVPRAHTLLLSDLLNKLDHQIDLKEYMDLWRKIPARQLIEFAFEDDEHQAVNPKLLENCTR